VKDIEAIYHALKSGDTTVKSSSWGTQSDMHLQLLSALQSPSSHVYIKVSR
jgi:hypothetical protein